MKRRVVLFALCLATGLALGYWLLVADLPSPSALITRTSPDATKIYDRNGKLLFEVLDPRSGRRSRVSLSELPLRLRQAVIAVEDANFYSNPGVDVRGITRALVQAVQERRIVSGGSTITQQLARDVLLSRDEKAQRTLTRKLREIVLALGITRAYSKDQILEMYLNEVYFGQLAYGVEAAAQAYFGKPARELDLAESALLAGLIQSPSAYNPLVNIDAAKERQAVVLELMLKAGFITREDADLAKAERLHFAGGNVPLRAPHFVSYIRSLLEERYGPERVNHGGLEVVTTLDLDLQLQAEAIVRRRMAELNDRQPGKPDYHVGDAALVAIDPRTGEILAMVGSADYFDEKIDGAVNVALAYRQPGSAIKPITYATAFGGTEEWGSGAGESETGSGTISRSPAPGPGLRFTPATVLSDVPTSFLTKENEPYRPMNYDRVWHGPISLRRGLATSSNMLAVKVLDAVGVPAMVATARALGITTLNDVDRYGLALTLGGGEVKLLELTSAYAGFANQGRRVMPAAIREVKEDGVTVQAFDRSNVELSQAVSPQVAYLITDILSDDEARLPAFGENSVLKLSRPAAAKTGTTTDWRDNWTLGYTPDLAVGVWVGNADSSPMQYISGITGAGPIWHDFMEETLKSKPVLSFPRPDGLVQVEVCDTSGLLPTRACERRRTELFIKGTEPTTYDNTYRPYDIDATTGLGWAEGCAGPKVQRIFRLLPADAEDWGRTAGIPEPPQETCNGQMIVVSGQWPVAREQGSGTGGSKLETNSQPPAPSPQPLVMVSPAPNTTFALSPQIPRDSQTVEVGARLGTATRLREVTLMVDGRPVATLAHAPYRALWRLEPGAHEASAVGTDADGRQVASAPVRFMVLEKEPGQQ